MSSALDEAAQRANLSLSNQMEMLTFNLTDNQLYAINVFKIIEIIECPRKIDRMPQSHPSIKGAIDFRGSAIAVIDLSEAVGMTPKDYRNELAYLIICEYSRRLTAFIVHAPGTLLTRSWSDIHKPEGVNAASLVAIAYGDLKETIMLLDIETILAEIVGIEHELSADINPEHVKKAENTHILLLDDSRTALLMLQSVLQKLGIAYTSFQAADQAITYLHSSLKNNERQVDLIISDIEMPGMDGFTFTRQLRDDPDLKGLPVILHSSMSNPSNRIKAEQAGANEFVAKFDPDVLAERIFALLGNQSCQP